MKNIFKISIVMIVFVLTITIVDKKSISANAFNNNEIFDELDETIVETSVVEYYSNNKMSNAVDINTVGIENFSSVKYISNKNYFIANPLHAEQDESYNIKGTCTTVAMQLLLGYHNYYTDRRLIPQTDGEDLIFLESNYGDILEYPSIDNSLSSGKGRSSLGTSDSVYHELYKLNSMGSLPGLGQSIGLVKDAAKKFVEEYSDFDSGNFNIESGIY